jgi:internalin A
MTNLQTLDISYNTLTNISSLAGLPALQWLNLDDNSLAALTQATVWTNLQNLFLAQNQITNVSGLSGLSSLLWLDLSGNRLAAIQPLSGLNSLQNLILTGNQLTGLSGLSGLDQLYYLNLSLNQMTALPALSGLPNLGFLVLSGNQLAAFPVLGGLPNLQTLDLSTNRITDLSNITTVPSLRWLYLGENFLATINPLTAPLAPGLYYADLRHNFLDTTPSSQASAVILQLQNQGVGVDYLPQQTLLPPSLTSPVQSGPNQFQFTINSLPAQVYQVQSSTDLIHWTPLTTVTNTTGTLQFADPSPSVPAKFYRLLEQ